MVIIPFTNIIFRNDSSIFYIYDMRRFSEINPKEKEDLYIKIKSLGSWLYQDDGLGLKNIINQIFQEEGWEEKLNSSEISKLLNGLEILKSTSMPQSWIEYRIKKQGGIGNLTIVKEQGKWHPVNKLNTNGSDLSDMISDLVMRAKSTGTEKAAEFYNKISMDPKGSLLSIKSSLKDLLKKYFIELGSGLDDFKMFTKNSKRQSEIGDHAETKVLNLLISKGFELKYRGGDGDFIDMLLGVDLVVYRSDIGYKIIQVKTLKPDWEKISWYKVDWIGVGNPTQIFDLKTREEIILDSI